MPTLKKLFPYILLAFVAVIFFYKYFLFGLIPFPGDLLVAEYQPFRSYSYGGYVAGSVPNKAQYFDAIREFYPWQTLTTSELKAGRLPVWNPYNFSGSPHLGNFLTAVFYPLNLLYLITNQMDAWAFLVVLQPLLASFFTFLYCRKLGLQTIGAFFAAVAFAYSSYINSWLGFQVIGHTMLWLPLIFYSVESLLERFEAKKYVLLVFALVSSIFAGHPLDATVVLLGSISYTFFRLYSSKTLFSKWVAFISPFCVALVIASIQIIPTIKLLSHSTRAAIDYDFLMHHLLIQPFQLIMLLVPDFFGNPATRNYWPDNSYVGNTLSVGVTSLFFIVFSIITLNKSGKHKTYIQYFLTVALVILVLITNNPLTAIIYSIKIPVVSSIQPIKLLSIFSFCLAMLAGIGVHELIQVKKIEKKTVGIIVAILTSSLLLCLFCINFVPQEYKTVAFKQTALSTALVVITLTVIVSMFFIKKKRGVILSLLVVLLLAEQYYAFSKFNPFSPREFIFPEAAVLTFLQENAGINRFWGYGTAKIDSNIATHYKLFSPDGFGALNTKWYNEFIRTSKDGKIPESFDQETRSIAEIEPGYGTTDLPSNTNRLKILDVLGVKYILNRTENPTDGQTFSPDRFKLVWQDEAGWQVYENLKSAPRFFLTNKVISYSDSDDFEQKFFDPSFDPRTMVLVEANYKMATFCSDSEIKNSTVILEEYKPSKVVFKTKTSCPLFLYVSDTFDDGWKATINENISAIYKTNYALRGVEIPAGSSIVVFEYSLF